MYRNNRKAGNSHPYEARRASQTAGRHASRLKPAYIDERRPAPEKWSPEPDQPIDAFRVNKQNDFSNMAPPTLQVRAHDTDKYMKYWHDPEPSTSSSKKTDADLTSTPQQKSRGCVGSAIAMHLHAHFQP